MTSPLPNKFFTRMGHVGIHVSNVETSMSFFKDILGFSVDWDGDADWAQVSLGGDDLGLIKNPPAKHPPHIGLRVPSLELLKEAHAELKARGVRVEAIKGHRDASQSFYFYDPDNNIFEALWMPSLLSK